MMKEERILISTGRPYMAQTALAESFGLSLKTIRRRLSEIDELIGDRYRETAVIHDGNLVLVNVLAFVDYMTYRQRLVDPRAKKFVPAFDPVAVRRDLGYSLLEEDSAQMLKMQA